MWCCYSKNVINLIDVEYMSTVLYENSELIQNGQYIIINNMILRYHEFQDNQEDILKYINNFDGNVKQKLKKCIIKEHKHCKKECNVSLRKIYVVGTMVVLILIIPSIMIVCIATKNSNYNYGSRSPPPLI